MASFKISAPGKVILFGEHAVVYDKTAVAASLNLRSSLVFNELPAEESLMQLEMPKCKTSKQFPVSLVQESLFDPGFPWLRETGHELFHTRIREFVDALGYEGPRQRTSLECFFYALVQVAQSEGLELGPFRLELDTELSVGAGVGSSASFSVCLVAGFLRWSQLQRDPGALPNFDSVSLDKISRYAHNCERIMHGAPSGIDNSVCTYGSIIEFRKGEGPDFISLGSLQSIEILLVDTKVERSTKLLVDKLAGLLAKYPGTFERIVEAMDDVSKQVIDIVKRMQALTEDETEQLLEAYRELSILVDVNQGLLSACQVSHSSLDLICMTAKRYGFSAKLTGAGGGGFAYILIPPDAANIDIENLSSDLTANGYSVIETNLGGAGVKIE